MDRAPEKRVVYVRCGVKLNAKRRIEEKSTKGITKNPKRREGE